MPGNYRGKMSDTCENLEKLLRAEIPALNAAFGHRRYLISKKMGKNPEDIDWKVAKKDFMDHYFNAFAEGFKMAYCQYVCDKRDTCTLKDVELTRWSRYAQ